MTANLILYPFYAALQYRQNKDLMYEIFELEILDNSWTYYLPMSMVKLQ